MKPLHLHFGSGALGLGLIVSEFGRIDGIQSYIFNRYCDDTNNKSSLIRNESLRKNRRFILKHRSESEVIRFKRFYYYNELNETKHLLNHETVIYFTVSLKEGLDECIPYLSELIHFRNISNIDFPLVFIAAENAIKTTDVKHKILQHLKINHGADYQINKNIIFLNCVIDRVCIKPKIIDDIVNIETEKYGEIIIDNEGLDNLNNAEFEELLTNQLSSVPVISLTYDFGFYVSKKRHVFNALHMLVALYAWRTNYLYIDAFCSDIHGEAVTKKIGEELIQILLKVEGRRYEEELRDYLAAIIERLQVQPARVYTALTRFTELKNLEAFFSDFNLKIGSSALKYMVESSQKLYYIPIVSLMLAELIATKKYVEKPELSE